MNLLVGLTANLPIDTGAVRHCVAARKSSFQVRNATQTNWMKTRPRQVAYHGIGMVMAPGDKHDIVSSFRQLAGNVASDKAGPPVMAIFILCLQ